jgi:hypothetical protein
VGRAMHQFCETALGDSRAEATLISGVIVPLEMGGRAIEMCGGGIPQKYWSAGTVAGEAAAWWGVEGAGAVGVGLQCVVDGMVVAWAGKRRPLQRQAWPPFLRQGKL